MIDYIMTVNGIARNILTATNGGEEIGIFKAYSHFRPQSFADIKVLGGVVILIMFKILDDPMICRHNLLLLIRHADTNPVKYSFIAVIP